MRSTNQIHHFPRLSIARWGVAIIISGLAGQTVAATVVNGGFDSGLTSWTTGGDVSAAAGASLGDNGVTYSLLYQGVALAPGQYRLEFDFSNLLSGDLSAGPAAFPDAFFASLYFINDLGSFDLNAAVFDDVTPLFDLDSGGPFNDVGTFSASGLGAGWTHYYFDFNSSYAYAIPVFELLDLNFIDADSAVHLDNVNLSEITSVVPEPSTLILVSLAVGSLLLHKRARRND